jgi:hypothetical protein
MKAIPDHVWETVKQFGPTYPAFSARVAKFRRIPRNKLTAAQRAEYATAIEEEIRAKQRAELQRELPSFKPSCSSGTWHNNADGKVGQAVRDQHRRMVLSWPDKIRKARKPHEWAALYDAAMRAKRANERR